MDDYSYEQAGAHSYEQAPAPPVVIQQHEKTVALQASEQISARPVVMQQPTTLKQTRNPRGWAKLLQALALVFLCDLVASIAAFLISEELACELTIAFYIVSIPLYIFAVILVHGRSLFSTQNAVIPQSLRIGWWVVLIAVVILIFDLLSFAAEGEMNLVDGWPARLGECVLICLGSGFTEEAAFRGLLFGGLLAVMGRTRKGIVIAALITSLAFGLAHVVPLDSIDSVALIQAGLKALETAMFSLLLCAIVLQTKSIVGTSLLHMFFNFCALLCSMLFTNETFEVSYVDTGDMADVIVETYVLLVVIQLPLVVRAIKVLKQTSAPNRGALWHYLSASPAAVVPTNAPVLSHEIPAHDALVRDVPIHNVSVREISAHENERRINDGLPPIPLG